MSFISRQDGVNPSNLTGEFNPSLTQGFFNNQPIVPPPLTQEKKVDQTILGETDSPKRIEVDLTNQRLYAIEGNQKIYDFLISSGKWGATPVGSFRIWTKMRYVLMKGGSKTLGTYYYLPNVPFVMFFYSDEIPKWRGFGIHGTYWHSNFGYPMSHGCINMKTEEAELLYYWAKPDLGGKNSIPATNENPGTEVVIYGEAP